MQLKSTFYWAMLFLSTAVLYAAAPDAPVTPENSALLTAGETRLAQFATWQSSADQVTAKQFKDYLKAKDDAARTLEQEFPILEHYNAAFDRVLREVCDIEIPPGDAVIWQLYNMGYIIKTSARTVGIDLNHRRAAELTDVLDMLLITHRHGDHIDMPLMKKMVAAGKPVISNFYEEGTVWAGSLTETFGALRIRTELTDHSKTLTNFVNIYELDFGTEAGGLRLLHTGDAWNAAQFNMQQPVDIFIPHLRIGMHIESVARSRVKPRYVLMSHIMELRHDVGKARWSLQFGLDECAKVKYCPAWLPFWGDRLHWNGRERTLTAAF